jgi:3',5'-cyclic AMP phosphodiesterase CpdA
LGKEQLDWLAAQLDARPEKPALIVAHHNPDPTGKLNGLKDTHQLLDVLTSRKQAKAFVFGHTHRWQHATVRGLSLVNVPTTAGVFDPAQPRAWLDVRFCADGARLTVHCLDRAHKAEGQVVDLKW